MPEIRTNLSPSECLERIEVHFRDWTEASLPESLRALRVTRMALDAREGNRIVIRFSIVNNPRLVSYCDCDVLPSNDGALAKYELRGKWNPRTAGLMVLALMCVQIVYAIFTGTFDRFNLIIAALVPSGTAALAHVDNLMTRKKYSAGMKDALDIALHH